MSWYKRTPRLKEPPKKTTRRRMSPATEKQLKELSEKQKDQTSRKESS